MLTPRVSMPPRTTNTAVSMGEKSPNYSALQIMSCAPGFCRQLFGFPLSTAGLYHEPLGNSRSAVACIKVDHRRLP